MRLDCDLLALTDLMNLRATFSFSTIYTSIFSMIFLIEIGSISKGGLSPIAVGIKYSLPVIISKLLGLVKWIAVLCKTLN
jgi:hypothetical protein